MTTSQPSPGSYKLLYDRAFAKGRLCYLPDYFFAFKRNGSFGRNGPEMHSRKEDIFVHDTLAVNIEAAMLLETGIEAMEQGSILPK